MMEMNALVISAIVVGIVELLKKTDALPSKWIPIFTLLLGVVLCFVAAPLAQMNGWREIVLQGIISGLSAMGLWSGAKHTTGR